MRKAIRPNQNQIIKIISNEKSTYIYKNQSDTNLSSLVMKKSRRNHSNTRSTGAKWNPQPLVPSGHAISLRIRTGLAYIVELMNCTRTMGWSWGIGFSERMQWKAEFGNSESGLFDTNCPWKLTKEGILAYGKPINLLVQSSWIIKVELQNV